MNIKRRSSHHRRNRTTTDLPLDLLNLNTNLINEEEDADHPGLGKCDLFVILCHTKKDIKYKLKTTQIFLLTFFYFFF